MSRSTWPRKNAQGRWEVQYYSGGQRKRLSFATKIDANQHLQQHRRQKQAQRFAIRLSEIFTIWRELAAPGLKDGKRRSQVISHAIADLGDPAITKLSLLDLQQARARWLKQVKPATCNRRMAYLRAMVNHSYTGSNPFNSLKPLRVDEFPARSLTADEIQRLFQQLQKSRSKHVYLVTAICLTTGARWSEAESLTPQDIGTTSITFAGTKSGKVRHVPADPQLLQALKAKPTYNGQLFRSSYNAFRRSIEKSGIQLPRGQLTHVLRHTFATHFQASGGNLIALQNLLGHSDIKMTMRYSHLDPRNIAQALQFSPKLPNPEQN